MTNAIVLSSLVNAHLNKAFAILTVRYIQPNQPVNQAKHRILVLQGRAIVGLEIVHTNQLVLTHVADPTMHQLPYLLKHCETINVYIDSKMPSARCGPGAI